MGQLANDTGGFLITDTNDLKSKLQKVDEDLHTYYLLSYASKNKNYDGHFRRIEVKLTGVSGSSEYNSRHRTGYYTSKSH